MNFELLKTLTILYVEDELSLQEDICQNILPFVKEIIRGSDGDEGLSLFMENRTKIDLIISDILMPKMNGIEMIDAIREVDSEIPIIYTTAFNDSEYMKQTIEQSIISYRRKTDNEELIVVLNFTPVPRENYRIGVPEAGDYKELLNSDSGYYAGSNMGNLKISTEPEAWMGQEQSIELTLPPLGALILKRQQP